MEDHSFNQDNPTCGADSHVCGNGDCLPNSRLCEEDESIMDEGTEPLVIIIGIAILLVIIILYCFRKRNRNGRNNNRNPGSPVGIITETDDMAALNRPPPSYNDVITTGLYPPSENRFGSMPILSEEPMTPPPNYVTALHILAQSEENLYRTRNQQTSVLRRSVSSDVYHSPAVFQNNFQRTLSTPREASQ